ncbi:MAG: division/cell wall cluster transcriptional repressor MraZ [Bacteroidales bacterium]|nr:division/cell wall cluster transcriptional repressor MraZ [Bacteroidales bacterium]MDD4604616.1 division/cell wall cluster transcriptional repressor MraZ [Bacteroidales bacterium]
MSTTNLIGEFECRLDEKSRIILPAALKKQISPEAQDKFVINRGFEGCLVLFPHDVWKETTDNINKLNLFVKDNRRFVRFFYNGATELTLDSQNRLLLPKSLLGFAAIEKEVILFAYSDRIEVWDKSTYQQLLSKEPEDFALLAEKVMGKHDRSDAIDELP